MRTILALAAIAVASVPAVALAEEATTASPAAAKFSTNNTINDLVANAEAKAVLEKHMPQILQAVNMVGGQSLRQLQSMAPDRLTDTMLNAIDADLAKIK